MALNNDWPRLPVRPAIARRLARPAEIHSLARFAFWSIFLLSLTNALGLLLTHLRWLYGDQFVLAVYPATFGVCMVLVLMFTKGVRQGPILWAAWTFWLAYFLGGFLGTEQSTGSDLRHVIQVVVKPWITMVGLPWLALRAIPAHRYPSLVRGLVLFSSIGAMVAVIQVFVPGFMQELNVEAGRGSGFWVNPNSGGVMCALSLFMSFVQPFERRTLNWTSRLLLVVGVAVSFSRAAMLALLVGWVVYGIMSGRVRSLLASLIAFGIFIFAMFAVLDAMDAVSANQAKRLEYVKSFLGGDWSSSGADNRTELWQLAFHGIVEKGGLILGLGHGSMEGIADGLQPHNHYLYVLGNSGLLALLCLLTWNAVILQRGWKCHRRETRAAIIAVGVILAVNHLVDSSLLTFPYSGAVLACATLGCYYGTAVVNRRNFYPGYVRSPARLPAGPRPGEAISADRSRSF
jgi:hypothetical protein